MSGMKAGVYPDLAEKAYHADPTSLSVTGAKVLLKSPALFHYERANRVEKDVFDFGSALHEMVLGAGPGIAVIPSTGRLKVEQEAHKAAKEQARADGKIPLSEDDHEVAKAMVAKLSEHTLASRLLRDGQPEVSAFCEDDATGVMRRCRYDYLRPTVAVDYKTTDRGVHPTDLAGRYGTVRKWRYDQQAAWYLDLGRDLDLDLDEFVFIFQAKTPPYSVTVARIPDHLLGDARADNARALEMFRDCTEADRWPDPVPDDECVVLNLDRPDYDQELIA